MSIEDRLDVTDAVYRLGRMVDDRNWDGLRKLFTDPLYTDYTSLWGGEPETLAPDTLIDRWQQLTSGIEGTQHFIGGALVDVGGDEASAVANVIAVHRRTNPQGGPHWTVGGTYDMRLVRTGDGWAISAITLRVAWTDGNLGIMNVAS
jgi:SnoaL-like domain